MRALQYLGALMIWVSVGASVAAAEGGWSEIRSDHFVLRYEKQVQLDFAQSVRHRAEAVYQDAIRYFGSLPAKNFWLWDNRCKIYLYATQSAYLEKTRQPPWSGGFAIPGDRTIVSFQGAPRFLDSILPHEMAHLIFREFVGVGNGQVPKWLDEGFAVLQERVDQNRFNTVVEQAVRSGAFVPFVQLNSAQPAHNNQTIEAQLFYAQAQSLTRFLLEGRDPSYFLDFCRLLRDGSAVEAALKKSYPHDFRTIDEFEQKWRKYVLQSSSQEAQTEWIK